MLCIHRAATGDEFGLDSRLAPSSFWHTLRTTTQNARRGVNAFYLLLPAPRAPQKSSLLFAAHHLSLTAALPLAALGATWSYLYLASGNLLVPVAIHALWNARVFAGTVLGL